MNETQTSRSKDSGPHWQSHLRAVHDLRRVDAVVEEVVLEHLRQLHGVCKEALQDARGQLGEGIVGGCEDRVREALLGRALHRRGAESGEGGVRREQLASDEAQFQRRAARAPRTVLQATLPPT